MRCNSRIRISQGRIRQLSRAAATALEQTGDVLMSDIRDAKAIPMQTGNLRGEAFHCDTSQSRAGKISLTHSTPYARRLYFHPEYNFNREFAANARGKWFEDWLPGGKQDRFAKDTFKALYKRGADT